METIEKLKRRMPIKFSEVFKHEPDYAVPPGETLLETIEHIGMTQSELATRMDRPIKTINEIINGKTAITPETALQLERVLQVPASFWNNIENNYQERKIMAYRESDYTKVSTGGQLTKDYIDENMEKEKKLEEKLKKKFPTNIIVPEPIEAPISKILFRFAAVLEYKDCLKGFIFSINLPENVPTSANPRSAGYHKTLIEIEKSAKKESEDFYLKNNGIDIACDSFRKVGVNEYEVTFAPGIKGIVNGGHTYHSLKSLKESIQKGIDIPITIFKNKTSVQIQKISKAKNMAIAVKKYSLMNLTNDFELIKKTLKPERIHNFGFYENQRGNTFPLITHLIQILSILNKRLCPIDVNALDKHPKRYALTISRVLKDYDITVLKDEIKNINIIIDFWCILYKKILTDVELFAYLKGKEIYYTLMNGEVVSKKIGYTFILPLIAAYRVFEYQDLNQQLINRTPDIFRIYKTFLLKADPPAVCVQRLSDLWDRPLMSAVLYKKEFDK